MSVRAVFGLPLFEQTEHLPEALESLLSQSLGELRIVVVDDSAGSEPARIVARYAERDPRIVLRRNERRLGLTRNWRRVFELALELEPDADYFAWASDHDVWHPRFLEVLVEELDRRPDAVLAAPDAALLGPGGELSPRSPLLDTSQIRSLPGRLAALSRGLRAGQMVYGLFRVEAVRRAGGFRHLLQADRLLLTEAALTGALVRVPETLWYRRQSSAFSLERQRRACFPDGVPVRARLPWPLVHAAALGWSLGLHGTGRPYVSRRAGLLVAPLALALNSWTAATSVWRSGRKRLRRRRRDLRARLGSRVARA